MNFRANATGLDRLYAALPYLLPLMLAFPLVSKISQFIPAGSVLQSLFMILMIPPVLLIKTLEGVLGPLAGLSDFIIFLVIYLLVVNNPSVKYFIRYHALQSLLIGIAASLFSLMVSLVPILPPMVTDVLGSVLGGGVLIASIYSMFSAGMGTYGSIPVISEAVESQMRYR
jgi:uncharacterized membrane protein